MARRRRHISQQYPGWEVEDRLPGGGSPLTADAGVSHVKREAVVPRYPVLATLRTRDELPSLRSAESHAVLRRAFLKGRDRPGRLERGAFRLVHYAVVDDHVLHLVCEATDRRAFSRGVQGLSIRVARGLNRLWGRKGKVFAERYDDRVLRSQDEVDEVLATVLGFGSGRRRAFSSEGGPEARRPTAPPRSRLLLDADPESA